LNEINYKILVVFVDKYGYVSEIADNMSRKFKDLGLKVDLVDLRRTRQSRWPTIDDYTGIILISAGRTKLLSFWTGKARKFALNYVGPLEKEKVIGFFRSDPWEYLGILNPISAKEKFAKSILKTFNFIPDYYEDFGPVLDFSRKSKIKRDDRKILKDSVKSIAKNTGIEFEYKGFNDFRDWNRIEEVCKEIAEQLQKGRSCESCGSIVPNGVEFCKNCGNKM
jgi:menaquinone-dependent protoporphyrinogen IX oxidase